MIYLAQNFRHVCTGRKLETISMYRNHINVQRVRITKDMCFETQISTYCCTVMCCGDGSRNRKMKLAVIGKTNKNAVTKDIE
jgi:hypothetical protein